MVKIQMRANLKKMNFFKNLQRQEQNSYYYWQPALKLKKIYRKTKQREFSKICAATD